MSFSDLKRKDVINVCDGRKLGKPIDLNLNESACVEALVVPMPCSFFRLFAKEQDGLAIPWNRVKRIGNDVILVEIEPSLYERG